MSTDIEATPPAEYPMSAVEKQTGLSAHVIRVWERRYQAVTPRRGANGRRLYSEKDLERLNLLAQLTDQGQTIGRIANLENTDLQAQIDALEQPKKPEPGPPSPQLGAISDVLLKSVLDSARCYDIGSCNRALSAAAIGIDTDQLMSKVCSPIIKAIGDEWEAGRINEAQEHIISTAFQSFFMGRITATLNQKKGPAAVFTTFTGERHQMGLMFFANMAAARNIRCFYLGPDLPEKAIAEATDHIEAQVVCISVVHEISAQDLVAHLIALRGRLQVPAEIWLGGPGADVLAGADLPWGCYYCRDDNLPQQLDDLVS